MRKSKEETLATQQTILKIALECFSKRGYALTTFADIAEKMHLTKGAIFWHYKSKEELLAALIVQEHAVYEPLKGIEAAQTPEEVKECFLAWATAIREKKELRQFMLFAMSRVEWSDALKGKLKRRLDELTIRDPFDRLEEKLADFQAAGLLTQALSAQQMRVLLSSVFFGTHREAWLHKREIDIARTLEAGLDFVLQGIKE